jgi:hypothetical protein
MPATPRPSAATTGDPHLTAGPGSAGRGTTSPSLRRSAWEGPLRRLTASLAAGVLVLGAGYAVASEVERVPVELSATSSPGSPGAGGTGLDGSPSGVASPPDGASGRPDRPGRPGGEDGGDDGDAPATTPGAPVPAGTAVVRAGEGRRSLAPQVPEGETWQRDPAVCQLLDPSTVEQLPGTVAAVASLEGRPWPTEDGCLYLGGYGIGPMNPMVDVDDEVGLWARALAIEGTDGGTFVLVAVDAVGWTWERTRTCPECGARAITERLGEELGIDPAGIWIHATHSHTSPDAMGAWGGLPDWYLQQMTAAIEGAVHDAVDHLRPAVLETAEVVARDHNRERRSTYRSAEEPHLGVLRALGVTDDGTRFLEVEDTGSTEVVATLATYAAHPTTRDAGSGVAHADWAGLLEATLDARDGGRTVHAQTGLGNLSTSGGYAIGERLAGLVPAPGAGELLDRADVRIARTQLRHPVSNLPLTVLGAPGFVDREFLLEPSSVSVGQSAEAPCVSAGAASIEAPVSAVRIGDAVALTAAPGELFANLSNTVKERSGARLTLPLSLIDDALGYIGQSFEVDRPSQQGLGFAADGWGFVDYEDSYQIDVCFGDAVLERTLQLLGDLAG